MSTRVTPTNQFTCRRHVSEQQAHTCETDRAARDGFTFALEAQQTPDEVGAAVAEGGSGQGHPLQAVAREARGTQGDGGPEVGLCHVVARQAGPHTAFNGWGAGIPA